MVAMFFLASAFATLLPLQSRYATADMTEQKASLVGEGAIIHAITKLQDGSAGDGDTVTSAGLDAGVLPDAYVYSAAITDMGVSPRTYRIDVTVSHFNQPVLFSTAHVQTSDLFNHVVLGQSEVELEVESRGAVDRVNFYGPIHSNGDLEMDVDLSGIPANNGSIFQGKRPTLPGEITYTGAVEWDTAPPPSDPIWEKLIQGGSAQVHPGPAVDMLDFTSQENNFINGTDNPNSLLSQALGGFGNPMPSGPVSLPVGGGLVIQEEVQLINLTVVNGNQVMTLYMGDDDNPTRLVEVTFDTGNDTTTAVDITDSNNPVQVASTSGLTNGIIYSTQDIEGVAGSILGSKSFVSEGEIEIEYDDEDGAGNGNVPLNYDRNLIPYGFTPDPNNPAVLPPPGNRISLISPDEVEIEIDEAPDGASLWVFANILAGAEVELEADDEHNPNLANDLFWYGSIISGEEVEIELDREDEEGDENPGPGFARGTLEIVWDLNNLGVVGLTTNDYKLVQYSHRAAR